ncbi:MAG: FixH family protein [Bacteroidota bacterium]
MKFNFGTGIALFYILFATMLTVFVIQAKKVNTSLVTKTYYDEDLAYQSHFEKIQNVIDYQAQLELTEDWDTQTIQLQFPANRLPSAGTIQLYRPSDDRHDVRFSIKVNASGVQTIPVGNLTKGLWEIKVDWESADLAFYQETSVYLQP